MHFGILFNAFLLGVGIYALWRGGRPEKIGALVNLGASLGSAGLRLAGLASWRAGSPTVAIDLAVTMIFYWLGCRTTRFWPVWSFGLALAIVSTDVAKLALPKLDLLTFASGQTIYVYLALLSLALGTFRASRAPRDPHHGFRTPCPTPSSPMHGNS